MEAAGNTVVYTAITSGYDILKVPPIEAADGSRFVAFLQERQPSQLWEIRQAHTGFSDPCRNAKIHKILPHLFFPEAQYSLWIDGSVRIKIHSPLAVLAESFLREHDLAVFRHRIRRCIYQEARACIRWRKDTAKTIREQVTQYWREGFPPNFGLAECTVLLRRHSDKMKEFNEHWWNEIQNHSRRDQLSFNYVAWKLKFRYQHLPGTIAKNPFFRTERHL